MPDRVERVDVVQPSQGHGFGRQRVVQRRNHDSNGLAAHLHVVEMLQTAQRGRLPFKPPAGCNRSRISALLPGILLIRAERPSRRLIEAFHGKTPSVSIVS